VLPDDGGCILTADEGYAEVTVSPPGVPAFELDVHAPMVVQI